MVVVLAAVLGDVLGTTVLETPTSLISVGISVNFLADFESLF
jgi:hypothetical protein